MDLNDTILQKTIDESLFYRQIYLADIPNIPLYMEQVTSFIDEKISFSKRDPSDKILTKTMINNYAKDKLIPPPLKKKYAKEHIVFLILIYHLKSILSIADIKILLTPLLKKVLDGDTADLFFVYEYFLKMQENKAYQLENSSVNSEIQKILTVFNLVMEANNKKRFAEKIIDNYF